MKGRWRAGSGGAAAAGAARAALGMRWVEPRRAQAAPSCPMPSTVHGAASGRAGPGARPRPGLWRSSAARVRSGGGPGAGRRAQMAWWGGRWFPRVNTWSPRQDGEGPGSVKQARQASRPSARPALRGRAGPATAGCTARGCLQPPGLNTPGSAHWATGAGVHRPEWPGWEVQRLAVQHACSSSRPRAG